MEALVAGLVETLRLHASWTTPAVAAAAFVGAIVPFGLLVPLSAIVLAAGTLAGSGAVNGASLLAASSLGMTAGSAFGYEIGRLFAPRLLGWGLLRRRRRILARFRLLARRHGAWSLAASRFLGPMRPLAPFLAGSLRMDRRRFTAASLSSALVWSLLLLLPAWVAGRAL